MRTLSLQLVSPVKQRAAAFAPAPRCRSSSLLQTSHNIIKMSQPEQIQEKQSRVWTRSLPVESIIEALEIDLTSKTGLRWKVRPRHHFNSDTGWRCFNARNAGNPAGCESADGRGGRCFHVRINNKCYKAHRIIYALAHGIDAGSRYIDHIDGCAKNNNPANLRLSTCSENLQNRGKYRNNTSGRKGVSWHNMTQKWQARIKINSRCKHLGYFHSIDDASTAYEAAARKHFEEFYRPS